LTETDKPETESKSASKAATTKAADTATKYSIERLLADAQDLTGYSRHIVAGALFDSTGDLSVEQVQSKVEKFLNREVKEG